MDEETANLIVKTYQDIYKLENLLKGEACVQVKELVESGATLNEMMNHAVSGSSSVRVFKSNLTSISDQIKRLKTYSGHFENIEIKIAFDRLSKGLSSLQSKIDNRE